MTYVIKFVSAMRQVGVFLRVLRFPPPIKLRGGSRGGAPGTRPPKIGKNMIFWRKIVIFHTKKKQNFSRLPPLGTIFLSAPTSFTTKTGRHDIAEILLKVALKHQKSNQIKS
jgi:hypothetical protein